MSKEAECPRCHRSNVTKCGKPNGYCLRCDDQTSYDYLKPTTEPIAREGQGLDRLPPDVARLVLAARAVAFSGHFDDARLLNGTEQQPMILELDAASEAFADRVAWDEEPEGAA